jgi:two-component system, chemotaxis family, chemotaxis protein CheY
MQALVVDDSLAMRSIMGRILRELGFEVVEAKNGQEALDHLQQGARPRVALVDWNMPVMDGVALLRSMRGSATWNDVPVMMVTAETESSLVVQALEAGADDYLMKPFTREMLVEKLDLLGIEHG